MVVKGLLQKLRRYSSGNMVNSIVTFFVVLEMELKVSQMLPWSYISSPFFGDDYWGRETK
jgi:hypothetical protein